jgi:hypothetical protein
LTLEEGQQLLHRIQVQIIETRRTPMPSAEEPVNTVGH